MSKPRWSFLFAFVLTLSSQVYAAEKLSYDIDGHQVTFVTDHNLHLTISASCKVNGAYSCQAYSAYKTLDASTAKVHSTGGQNPGALICAQILKGDVVVGKDHDGDEDSFCSFGDGSMIGDGSLMYKSMTSKATPAH